MQAPSPAVPAAGVPLAPWPNVDFGDVLWLNGPGRPGVPKSVLSLPVPGTTTSPTELYTGFFFEAENPDSLNQPIVGGTVNSFTQIEKSPFVPEPAAA